MVQRSFRKLKNPSNQNYPKRSLKISKESLKTVQGSFKKIPQKPKCTYRSKKNPSRILEDLLESKNILSNPWKWFKDPSRIPQGSLKDLSKSQNRNLKIPKKFFKNPLNIPQTRIILRDPKESLENFQRIFLRVNQIFKDPWKTPQKSHKNPSSQPDPLISLKDPLDNQRWKPNPNGQPIPKQFNMEIWKYAKYGKYANMQICKWTNMQMRSIKCDSTLSIELPPRKFRSSSSLNRSKSKRHISIQQ